MGHGGVSERRIGGLEVISDTTFSFDETEPAIANRTGDNMVVTDGSRRIGEEFDASVHARDIDVAPHDPLGLPFVVSAPPQVVGHLVREHVPAVSFSSLTNCQVVYQRSTAEDGLWIEGATRTTAAEIAGTIAGGEIAVARMDGAIVGAVRIQQLDASTGEFGMLVADPDRRGVGVGRDLITFAEELSRQRGLTVMELEVLVPRDWKHPTKEFLHAWYTRIGYQPVRSGTIDERYPKLAPLLATPCDFVIYHKNLSS